MRKVCLFSLLFVLALFSVTFAGTNPYIAGSSYGCAGWNCGFTTDGDIFALYNFETGALTTDSSNSDPPNTLTNVGTATATDTYKKQGSYSTNLIAASTQYYNRADADLISGFPMKSGETNSVFTVCGWVRVEIDADGVLFAKYDGSTANKRSWSVYYAAATNKITMLAGYTSGRAVEVLDDHDSALSLETWYHVCASYAGDVSKAFAIRIRDENGNVLDSDKEGTTSNALSITAAPFSIGANYSAGSAANFIDGQIDEVVVFDRVLNATECTNIAKGVYK